MAPSTSVIDELVSASWMTPTRLALMTEVGPPDWPTTRRARGGLAESRIAEAGKADTPRWRACWLIRNTRMPRVTFRLTYSASRGIRLGRPPAFRLGGRRWGSGIGPSA